MPNPKQKKKPIITNDPNDPRIKAYNDSLSLYNMSTRSIDKLFSPNVTTAENNLVVPTNREWQAYNNLTKLNKTKPSPYGIKKRKFKDGTWGEVFLYEEPNQPITYKKKDMLPLTKGVGVSPSQTITLPNIELPTKSTNTGINQYRLYPQGNMTEKDIKYLRGLNNPKVNEALGRTIENLGVPQYGESDSDMFKQLLKQPKMKKGGLVKYQNGFFVENSDLLGNAANFGSGLLETFATPNRANVGIKTGQGVLSGAAAGAALGPLGAIAGGAIGGVTSLIGAGRQKRQLQREANQRVANVTNQQRLDMNSVNVDPYGQLMEDGGDIHIKPENRGKFNATKKRTGKTTEELTHSSNPITRKRAIFAQNASKWKHADGGEVIPNLINIEAGELQINPQTGKILREYKGVNPETGGMYEPHSKKGKDTNNNIVTAEPGTFIITKKKASDYKKAIDNNDKMHQQTILMNIRNDKKKKAINTKYALGDFVEDPVTKGEYWNQANGVVPEIPLAGYAGVPPRPTSYKLPTTLPTYTSGYPSNSNTGSNINVRGGLDFLSKYGPSILNTTQGLFGNVEKQPYGRKITNPYINDIRANLPRDVNIQPLINEINTNQALADRDIANNVNSSSVYRANRQQLASNTNNNIANVRMQAKDRNNQYATQRANVYNQLGTQDMNEEANLRNYNFQVDDINSRNRAAKKGALNTGLEQAQQTYMNDQLNNSQEAMQAYALSLLPYIAPATKGYSQYTMENVLGFMDNYRKNRRRR